MDNPQIIAETDDFLVINKPAGWVVNKAESVVAPTIQEWSGGYPVHRLDKDTNGVLLIAKNESSLAEFQRQFKQRLTKKTYLALVHGKLEPREGVVSLPVGRKKTDRHKFSVRVDGKTAETSWRVERYVRRGDEWLTQVKLFPKTGRTHQLRVHMVHLKHPIAGDPVYLAAKKLREDLKWCGGLRLQAKELCFFYKGKEVCYGI